MTMNVPAGIKRRFVKSVAIRLSIFFGVLILLVLAFSIWKPLSEISTNNRALTFFLCIIIDAAATGVPFKIIRRSWQGKVIGIKVKTKLETWNPTKPTISSWYTENTVILNLQTPDGKPIVRVAERPRAPHSSSAIERYKKGDYAARIKGGIYPAHYDSKTDETRCVICGSYNPNSDGECKVCHNPLVTFTKQDDSETA